MTLEEKKQAVIEEFSMYDEWLDKYEYLIELGKALEAYPEEEKTEDKLIKGCQSRVWLDYELKDGKLFFRADSDAIITKGIISLLLSVYSGRTPEEIAADDFGFVDAIGLRENLSPTRANGLVSMIETIKSAAREMADQARHDDNGEMADQVGHDDSVIPGSTRNPEDGVLTAEDVAALQPLYADVILALKQVYDPEIPVNIYDLGLIYELNIDKERKVSILMTFTAPNCPMADEVMHEVEESVKRVPGVTGCHIELTFEPVWDRSMLSEEARVDLGLDYEEDDYGKLND
ncbi:MAG: SufE family protein [Bacteroidales bacterium]|nr:SufE family protein [Bacteroidales bacterium]